MHPFRTLSIVSLALTLGHIGCSEPETLTLSMQQTDQNITVYAGAKPVLVYNLEGVSPPEGVDPMYRKSGFIHPVYTPGGQTITQSFGKSHPHQNGIFMAWTQTQFRGEEVDFWNVHKGLGQVSHSRLLHVEASEDEVSFEVELAHKEFVGETHETVLNEILRVVVYPVADDVFVFDVSSRQSLATDEPLILSEYHYGGMALRLTDHWYGKENDQVAFTTSTGLGRIDGNHTRQNWVAASGRIDGRTASIAVLSHPSNFRAPQPVRIHHKVPYFSYSPMVLGEFSINPGEEYVSRYRYLVSADVLDNAQIDKHWEHFLQRTEQRLPSMH